MATRVSEKIFDTPEQLMAAMKDYCDGHKDARGVNVITLTGAEK